MKCHRSAISTTKCFRVVFKMSPSGRLKDISRKNLSQIVQYKRPNRLSEKIPSQFVNTPSYAPSFQKQNQNRTQAALLVTHIETSYSTLNSQTHLP